MSILSVPYRPGTPTHPTGKGSNVATCPTALDPPPGVGGLLRHHVPRATGPTTRQGKAPVSPCVLPLQTCLSVWEGSGIITCPMELACHPTGKGSGIIMCHVAPDPPPGVGGPWRHHVLRGSQPSRHACAFPRHLTSGSSWPHQARGASSALNAYKTLT
jgi:hypothetical protein